MDRAKLPITAALKARKGEEPKSVKKRPAKERKIRTSVGITITLKDGEMKVAVREAMAELERVA